jgi:6-phosphogluconolactonase (cycloisomerase 2 family)
VTFARNATTGALSFVSRAQDGVAGVDGLDGATGVVVSPDGRNVYTSAASDSAVAVFARNATTGALSFVERRRDNEADVQRLNSPYGVAVSDDGRWVLATSSSEDALNVFRRDEASGRLFFAQLEVNGASGVTGMLEPHGIAIARRGFATYVTNGTAGSVVAFTPEPGSAAGALGVAGTLLALRLARRRRRG